MSALVAGPGAWRLVSAGEDLAFCHQVTVASAVVRRSGEVQAGGWLPDHVTLGVLEAHLPAGEIEELVEDFGCWERRPLLPAAMAIRLVIAMALARRRYTIPAEPFEALFWLLSGPIAGPDARGMSWRGFLVCALERLQVAVPDTGGTGRISGRRARRITSRLSLRPAPSSPPRPGPGAPLACPSSDGEQALTQRLVRHHPEVFAPGRTFVMTGTT